MTNNISISAFIVSAIIMLIFGGLVGYLGAKLKKVETILNYNSKITTNLDYK